VVFATLARKLQTPYPIVLVIAGCCSVSSWNSKCSLNPDVIFLVVLRRCCIPQRGYVLA